MLSFQMRVGRIEAGLAILITNENRLVEFPSALLPSNTVAGSIIDIAVNRNRALERESEELFTTIQSQFYRKYGRDFPQAPTLRVRNCTQTSVVLEWEPLELRQSKLKSFNIFRNSVKAGSVPNPCSFSSIKVSGLSVDTEYQFHAVLDTSAGVFVSPILRVKTHKMTDLSGLVVCVGSVSTSLRNEIDEVLKSLGAKASADSVSIETTHYLASQSGGPLWGAVCDANIPAVSVSWLFECKQQGRILSVRSYYLSS
ncbi:hypothetical protein BJ508DRAFT_414524 [Ascobolus immersus RN42]|uniref:BRCT domain-containing protein n=1 Tax=Ascobolus immersus RN42 TaxID=1160509 RepID=A0A3N4IC75_ASCIM|nr:hypothetical protein BJ508DRAFT_414524 [Ascobolus immersus RN42]